MLQQNVGQAVSALRALPVLADLRAQQQLFDLVARRYGFRHCAHLANVVAERTTRRWALYNFPC